MASLGHELFLSLSGQKTFDWQAENLSSLVNQDNQIDISLSQNTKAKTIRVSKYLWFFPSLVGMVFGYSHNFIHPALGIFTPDAPPMGPRWEGYRPNVVINIEEEIEDSFRGFQAPFEDFVMYENQKHSGIAGISNNTNLWDQKLYKAVLNTAKKQLAGKDFGHD